MSIQNIILLIAAGINLLMSILVFSRGVKNNKINLYFSLLTLFNFLWAISLFLSLVITHDYIAGLFYRTAYFSAIGIAVFLFNFLYHFPHKIYNIKNFYNFIIFTSAILIAIFVYSKWHIIYFSRSGTDLVSWVVVYYKPFYLIYSIFFCLLVVIALSILMKKIGMLEGVMKNRVKILLITIIVAFIFGTYFNLILPFLNNWQYIWFGPIFTALMNIYVLRLMSSANSEKL